MRTIARFRGREEPFDPVLLMAALDACPESLAVVEKGHIIMRTALSGPVLTFQRFRFAWVVADGLAPGEYTVSRPVGNTLSQESGSS